MASYRVYFFQKIKKAPEKKVAPWRLLAACAPFPPFFSHWCLKAATALIPTFPWINIVFVTIISNLDFFQGKGWQKIGKKHAFDAGSTGSWLVAAFQGAVTIVRVIFSTVSPGLSPPQLLTDSTKN